MVLFKSINNYITNQSHTHIYKANKPRVVGSIWCLVSRNYLHFDVA